ncbi:NADP-dependent oxidoreductase [Streptomyces fulvoviolaceus]|uniref:NADP-dependent oxidoreductase n=1 Tax=Streptomyces fulvoviolaceus TaxID=285535 RepID=UPI0004CB19B6|nr:NADP-dependent oxidoreductase [Streptomyces fulvoviolaceus]
MRAVVMEKFGAPSVLVPAELPVPEPGPGQVRVRVAAAGVNPIDARIRSGSMKHMFPTPLPAVLGMDIAGTVDALGSGVTDWSVGQEVLGWAEGGGYAEYALATAVVAKPGAFSWEQAAALPSVGETAQRALRVLAPEPGQTLLVHGASGAVGSLVVQLAKARGIRVIGTARAENHAYLTALGAEPVAYGEGLVDRVRELSPQGVDAVLDAAGAGVLPDSLRLCPAERVLTIADMTFAEHGVRFSRGGGTEEPDVAALGEAVHLVAAGELTVHVAGTYPLAEAATAHRDTENGHAPGKLILLP